MSEWLFMLRKHARFMLPLLLLLAIVNSVNSLARTVMVQQVCTIVAALIMIGMSVYALDDGVVSFALCRDRFLLMMPLTRWRLVLCNVAALGLYLGVGYGINAAFASIGILKYQHIMQGDSGLLVVLQAVAYLVALMTGIGIMMLLIYISKRLPRWWSSRVALWGAYSVVLVALVILFIQGMDAWGHTNNWLIGLVGDQPAIWVYAGILPIVYMNTQHSIMLLLVATLCNACLGLVSWLSVYALSHAQRANNYITLR